MTIDEAKETLEDLKTPLPQSPPEKRRQAVQFGIEALDAFIKIRKDRLYIPSDYRLPSETNK